MLLVQVWLLQTKTFTACAVYPCAACLSPPPTTHPHLATQEDGEGEEGEDDELVPVKQATPCVVIHGVGARVQQGLEALLQVLWGQGQGLLLLL
jgi:hypothetical protein